MLKRSLAFILLLAFSHGIPSIAGSLSSSSTTTSLLVPLPVIEYYNKNLDHYFITADPTEIAALDSGTIAGWMRTGAGFTAYSSDSTSEALSPVCRFYGIPDAGSSSHFYSAAPDECSAVLVKFSSTWFLESNNVFQVQMADRSSGACPSGTAPVYRVFNNRSDADHRYTTDEAVKRAMVSQGYVAEGYGPDGVVFCAASPALTDPADGALPTVAIVATPLSPDTFDFGSNAVPVSGTSIVAYAWDFGDGTTGSGATVSHEYGASGTYPVILTVVDSRNAVAKANKNVNVSKPSTPGPTPASSPAGTRVRVSVGTATTYGDGTNSQYASRALQAAWIKAGGDWFDANGQFNGDAPTIAVPITVAGPVSVDISGIDGDLLVQGIQGWDSPMIDGRPAVGFWTDPASENSFPPPTKYGNPGIILNPGRGKILTFTTGAIGQTVRIDKVAGALIPDDPPMTGPSNHPDIFELEMTDFASILAQAGGPAALAGGTTDWAYSPEFGVDPNGLKYLRFTSDPTNPRLISWFLPVGAIESGNARYCIYLEDDIADGMVELGVKLPGFTNDGPGPAQSELVSWRMEHGPVASYNRDIYAFNDYLYDAESGPGYGNVQSMGGTVLRAGRWYVIEQRIQLNTPGKSDGYGEIFLNGKSVWKTTTALYRNQASTRITNLHVNVYHGGATPPKLPIHYRIAKIGVSSSYIGVPPELLSASAPVTAGTSTGAASYPAWRQGRTKDVFSPITGTANMDGVTSLGNGSSMGSNTIDTWNGLAAGRTSWWAAANGGHDQGNGTGWENKVYKIELADDIPKWTLVHPGSPQSMVTADADHYLDGLPVSRHTYYSAQYLESLGRVFLVTAAAPYAIGFPGPAVFQGGPIVDAFNTATGNWDAPYTWVTAPRAVFYVATSVAKNPATDDLYVAGNYSFAKWTRATNTWSRITPLNPDGTPVYNPGTWEFKPTLIDVKRNRWMTFASFPTIVSIDLTTNVLTTLQGGGPLTKIDDYSAVVHDLDNDRYITIQGGKVYTIDPETGMSAVLGDVPPPANGVQTRLAYFQALGGIAYLPGFISDILFMPTR